ncbi:alkene reductase [Streptomyces albipurpureus]|uniref:Alkene reductase n=1 Tax=Streptomyces albipurpureus TaxID=2897419 RepID=A0ABT0UJK8_9ACTN|nr:alkene reductase [Streptomyces sp. CWNU-1]MCM2388683.1 alkene reductase [Streptomyces sp. CWNU-1]
MTNTRVESRLFEPARLGLLDLPNRLVMAPLTRNRAGADGVPGALMAAYYAQRASAGLIIAEAAAPNQVGQTYPNIPAIHNEAQVAGWRRVTEVVRGAGGQMVLQLQHGGRVGHPETSGLVPIAPSPIALPETIHTPSGRQPSVVPREMTVDDIQRTVADFAAAARNAVAAGFEGVEVHAANGHLLHQFMATNSNRRTDAYGGPVEYRIRFVVEVVSAVAEAIGPERVGVRISPGGVFNGVREDDTEALYPVLVEALAGIGSRGGSPVAIDTETGGGARRGWLSYLHLVFADPEQALFRRIRAAWPGTLIANPLLGWGVPLPADGGRVAGERLLEAGADLIALGRAFLANPDLVERLRSGASLNPLRDQYFMYTGGATGYSDYPTLADSQEQTGTGGGLMAH